MRIRTILEMLSSLGVQGVLNAYVNCVTNIQLWGPTNVAPIINHVARFARDAQGWERQGRGASVRK